MNTLLATEIYGLNEHVEAMARLLAACGGKVAVVDPYCGARPGPMTEQDAYARFLRDCGPERYAELVAARAEEWGGEPFCAVGFSAGAAAVWALACGTGPLPAHAFCFYGSGIRHMTERAPRCPVDAVIPCREPHFDVAALGRALAAHSNVTCHATPWLHGFMNPLSPNLAPDGYALWLARLEAELRAFSLPAG
ncbi:dienelactone hydrolase family protein [Paucidesulfovibrio longus]|uniref:dienelactone hydrolase family protein n=1 Tax=Paucidesulfovibrio longus TaxID=889 RepID=UPI0003B2F305|nr:dienelactone hydrolase family protein [Paucidesulfovibrio longus]